MDTKRPKVDPKKTKRGPIFGQKRTLSGQKGILVKIQNSRCPYGKPQPIIPILRNFDLYYRDSLLDLRL